MNKEEITKALEIIREPITVNCKEYHYFDDENYSKLINVYENCLWFINNFEQINATVELVEKENEKLNHYKLLYQKVKERNDKAIEYLHETCNIGLGELSIYGDDINPCELKKILEGESNE